MHRIFQWCVVALWVDLVFAFSPTPPPALAGCFRQVQDYIDRPSTDRLPNGGVVSNPAACQRKCQHESWCDHFVWKPAANIAKGFFAKGCWLLNGNGSTVVSSAATTEDLAVHGPKVCPQTGSTAITAHRMKNAKAKSNRTGGPVNRTSVLQKVASVEQRQDITKIGTKKLIRRVASYEYHKLEWWMIMLISVAAFATLMLLCHRCSCNKKRKTLQTLDDLAVEPGEAIMDSESKVDDTAVKPVEMLSQASAKSDHRLDHASHENLFDGPNEQLALGCPWVPQTDKVSWWNPLDVWPRSPAHPTGYSALLQVPPLELWTPPLVPSMWHQDVAYGVPVERHSSDGFCLSERSGSSPLIAGPPINRPRTPGLSCSSKPETVSGADTPSFASLGPTPSCSSHHLHFPEKVACSLPFQNHVGASCNHHVGRESRTSLRSHVVPLSPERVQQAVRPLREGSSPERVQQAVMPPREGTSPERVHRVVMPPREGTLPERVHRTVMPPREGSSPPAMMPPCEGSLPVADVLSMTPSKVAGEPSTRSRRLSPERVQTLQSTLKFVDLPFVRHDI